MKCDTRTRHKHALRRDQNHTRQNLLHRAAIELHFRHGHRQQAQSSHRLFRSTLGRGRSRARRWCGVPRVASAHRRLRVSAAAPENVLYGHCRNWRRHCPAATGANDQHASSIDRSSRGVVSRYFAQAARAARSAPCVGSRRSVLASRVLVERAARTGIPCAKQLP